MKIRSWHAYLIYALLITGGYVWATFFEDAPFLAFATQITIGFGVYVTKRLVQKRKEFNHED